MSLADAFSGGEDSVASMDLETALSNLANVTAPTAAQLTLPQLQEYVQAGILTPEQAQAYTVNNNAYDSTTADNSGMDTELSTIGQLQDIVNKGGNDSEEQQNIQGILNSLNTTESGNNAAILRDAAARGVSNSGTTLAARLASNQNDATNANSNALAAGATAEARNLAALSSAGSLGANVQGQDYTQDVNKANAANAIAQFNAQQNQQVGNMNTTEANAAKAGNLEAAQQVSNANTASDQMQEESGPAAQQQAFQDALQKAGAITGAADASSSQSMQQGEQNAGIIGGLASAGGGIASSYFSNPYNNNTAASTSTPNTNVSTNASAGEANVSTGGRMVPGGVQRPMNMKSGGPVPGQALVPGDSPKNDTQLADLSPDEIVLPRTVSIPAMQGDTSKVIQFLKSLPRPAQQAGGSVHPRAVLDTLRALSAHHSGVA